MDTESIKNYHDQERSENLKNYSDIEIFEDLCRRLEVDVSCLQPYNGSENQFDDGLTSEKINVDGYYSLRISLTAGKGGKIEKLIIESYP